MKKVKADRYQKQRSPEPEEIDFSGPAIGAKPSKEAIETPDEETKGDRTVEKPNERPDGEVGTHNSYLIAVPEDRVRTRHSFGIFEDQKLALDRLQMAIRDVEGEKPNLGEMVQRALDDYIERRTRELPNVQMLNRTNERSDGESSHE